MIRVKFTNNSNNPDPVYSHDMDSGFDLRANVFDMLYIPENDKPTVYLRPLERLLIPTGLFFELPEGFEMQVRPRSGLAIKNGITVLNTPGTVDNAYTGEICVVLINLSQHEFKIQQGDRIAQAVIAPVWSNNMLSLERAEAITENNGRGSGGFGSTGVQ
jgi:dUTP pyrophosphatase